MALGFPHPDFLLRILTPQQMDDWMAYYSIEPFGQYPDFLRAGIIAATIANVFRGKNSKTFSPEDFMPGEPSIKSIQPKVQTLEEQKLALNSIYALAKKRGLTKEPKKILPKRKEKRK